MGVAAVSYVACSSGKETVANLIAPPDDAGAEASDDAATDALQMFDVVANLIAPPDDGS